MPDHVHQHDDDDLQEWSVSDISVSDQSPQLLVLLVLVWCWSLVTGTSL